MGQDGRYLFQHWFDRAGFAETLWFVLGAIALSVLSVFQKKMLGADPFALQGFIVPVLFGGTAALLFGFYLRKSRRQLMKRLQAETTNQEKSNLMANMSHELRTPLNSIIGFAESMREEVYGPLGSDKYREYLADIHNSGEHLLELINDILDASAIEAGALTLHEENISLLEVMETSVRLIKPRADAGRVTVSFSIDPDISLIFADPRRIKQIILNLLSNAVKFSPEEGEVYASAWLNDDGAVIISVDDSGVGMDQEEAEIALSEFGQVDSGLNRKHEGTGLGLPLTMGLLELHGGTLEIKSKKGYGTVIAATLPKERVIHI